MQYDYTLVMTAAVNPNGMPEISEESQNGREDQYIRTLRFYAGQECVTRVLFVENSNWDLTRIKESVQSDKIEYMSLNANAFPREWGKGYGEMYIMDRAIEHLVVTGRRGVFVKVTGRFPVLNIKSMMREFSRRAGLKLSVDVIEHGLYRLMGKDWNASGCRTIIYACDVGFYMKNLYGRYKEIPSRFSGAEGLMRDVWNRNKDVEGVYSRFKREPHLSGYAGAVNYVWLTANNYDSLLARTKRGVKQFCRWFLPNLWL